MSDTLLVLGWVALGFCVSVVAMVLPFRKGARGVALNMAIGVGGAVAGGMLGWELLSPRSANVTFATAVTVSLLATVVMHVVVLRRLRAHAGHSAA